MGVEWWGMIAGVVWTAGCGLVVWTGNLGPLVFNPFDPLAAPHATEVVPGLLVWWMYAAGVCITLGNLLPMAPFAAGQVMLGSDRASDAERLAGLARTGYVVAMTLFVAAAAFGHTRVMAVAAVGALVTWLEVRKRWLGAMPVRRWVADEPEGLAGDAGVGGPEMRPHLTLDEVLEKISRDGLASLDADERALLEDERRRRISNDRGHA